MFKKIVITILLLYLLPVLSNEKGHNWSSSLGGGSYITNGYGFFLDFRTPSYQSFLAWYLKGGSLTNNNALYENNRYLRASHLYGSTGMDLTFYGNYSWFWILRSGIDLISVDPLIARSDFSVGGIVAIYGEWPLSSDPNVALNLGFVERFGHPTDWKSRNQDFFNGVGSEFSLRYYW